jgi:hypothetical protein
MISMIIKKELASTGHKKNNGAWARLHYGFYRYGD